jgi:hypothetical protein
VQLLAAGAGVRALHAQPPEAQKALIVLVFTPKRLLAGAFYAEEERASVSWTICALLDTEKAPSTINCTRFIYDASFTLLNYVAG